ncbi:MAG TPA: SagB/ThcOx family dehydrogenase [bacterium]|nr:SagB/ThcOx family dehydrogenase [bacterium]
MRSGAGVFLACVLTMCLAVGAPAVRGAAVAPGAGTAVGQVALSGLEVKLPAPKVKGSVSVEDAIKGRRTVRSFSSAPMTLDALSQILWSAQGITDVKGFKRAAPSAGATFPIEVYFACGEKSVKGLRAGLWRYVPAGHSITRVAPQDARASLARHSLGQMWAAEAPVTVAIVCDYSRTTGRYGKRGVRYVHFEAGSVAENIFLESQALGLSVGIIGAFDDKAISADLKLPKNLELLLLMPVGYKRSD